MNPHDGCCWTSCLLWSLCFEKVPPKVHQSRSVFTNGPAPLLLFTEGYLQSAAYSCSAEIRGQTPPEAGKVGNARLGPQGQTPGFSAQSSYDAFR